MTSERTVRARVLYLLRWTGAVGALVAAAWHVNHAIEAYHGWQEWKVSDPSMADLYLTEIQVESFFTFFLVVAAALTWRFVRPRSLR